MWQLYTGGTATSVSEKFRLYTPASSSNVYLMSTTGNAILGFNTGDFVTSTNAFCRMKIQGEPNGTGTDGYITMGNVVSAGFAPVDRLHLYHTTSSTIGIRLSNVTTGSLATDGMRFGIDANGNFRMTQYENRYTDFLTPNTALTDTTRRMRISPNGQVFIGNPTMSENPIAGAQVANFPTTPTTTRTSLLNVRGPINTCADMFSLAAQPTVLYGYTSPVDNTPPAGDGFRMHMNISFDTSSRDALVFEKTDDFDTVPDGLIAFTNTGFQNIERVSAYINGRGRTCFGTDYFTLTNRVTIDSEPNDATPSGLRFIDLLSSSTPVTNPGSGVLAVDVDGNVIYVPATGSGGSGSGFGNLCTAASNPLTGNFEIPLNNHNYYFTRNGAGNSINDVLIGYACGTSPLAKLDVRQEGYSGGFSPGIGFTVAGRFYAVNPASLTSTAVEGVSTLGTTNTGQSTGGNFNATGGGTNFGIISNASGGTTNVAGWINGDLYTNVSYLPSDQNLKENIEDYHDASNVLSQLHPKSYHFRTAEYPQLNLESSQQIGLLSQELEQVLPHAVKELTSPVFYNDSTGEVLHPSVTFKAVSYEKLIPVLVGGHQEQTAEIVALQQENTDLRNQLNDLNSRFTQMEQCLQAMFPGMCQATQGMIQQNSQEAQQQLLTAIPVNLSDKNAIVLNQNVPNPFAESTVITYSVPATVKKAQIHFYDAGGKLLQSVEISERGAGKLQVFGNDLSSGIYTYTLVADGQVAVTKKLVKL